jgi:hypothetical protein
MEYEYGKQAKSCSYVRAKFRSPLRCLKENSERQSVVLESYKERCFSNLPGISVGAIYQNIRL